MREHVHTHEAHSSTHSYCSGYTTFAGRLGAVDEQLVDEGRLRVLADADSLELVGKSETPRRPTRDPTELLDRLLSALAG